MSKSIICSLVLFAATTLGAQDGAAASQLRDDGRLDPAWFGSGLGEFHGSDKEDAEFDFLWVKPGFSFKGRTLMVGAWESPNLIGDAKRDADELKLAQKLTRSLPKQWQTQLAKQLKGSATVSPDAGDLVMTGRIVDCMGPSGFSWFTFSNITYDLKITDKETGELLVALHNRKITGADLEEDQLDAVKEFAPLFKDPAKLYAAGESSAVIEARKKAEKEKEAREEAEEEEKEKKKKK